MAYAIQAGAIKENPNIGPDGMGVRSDDQAYTLEARAEVQAIAFPEFLSGTQCASSEEVSPVLQSTNPTAVCFQPRIGRNGRGYAEEHTPALNGADAGATSDMRPCVAHSTAPLIWQVRRLTPRECERLQGFPDDWTKVTVTTKDGPRYKAIGNSMAVPVMRWIGEGIAAVSSLSP